MKASDLEDSIRTHLHKSDWNLGLGVDHKWGPVRILQSKMKVWEWVITVKIQNWFQEKTKEFKIMG